MPSEPLIASTIISSFKCWIQLATHKSYTALLRCLSALKKTTSDWQSLTPANVGMSLHIAFPPLDGQVGPFSFWRTPIHGGATQEDPPNLSTIRRHQWWSLGSKPKDVKDDLSWKKLARFLEEHQESLKSCFCFRWFS